MGLGLGMGMGMVLGLRLETGLALGLKVGWVLCFTVEDSEKKQKLYRKSFKIFNIFLFKGLKVLK